MKKQNSKRLLFEMMAKVNPDFILKEEVINGYNKITMLYDDERGKGEMHEDFLDSVADDIINSIDDEISDAVRSLSGSQYGGQASEDMDFDVTINRHDPNVHFDVSRVVCVINVGVDSAPEQKGGLFTEPLDGYWNATVKLEKIQFIDDKNKTIYEPPKESFEFGRIDWRLKDAFDSSDTDDYFEPYEP